MPVQIPLWCVRRDRQTKEIITGRPKRFDLEIIHEPSQLPEDRKTQIVRQLVSATQSGFRRSQVKPQEVIQRTVHPDTRVLILVKRNGRALGYYSMETVRVNVQGKARNGIFLRASVLHSKAKGFGLMGTMQAAAVLMGKEYFRMNRKVAHFVAATTQKPEVARTLEPYMTQEEPEIWQALAHTLYPHARLTPEDRNAGIVRGAFADLGPLYGGTPQKADEKGGTLDVAAGDARLLVSRAIARSEKPAGLQVSGQVRLQQIIHAELKAGLLGQALQWSAPRTHAAIHDPKKPYIPTILTAAIQEELAGKLKNTTRMVNPESEPELKRI